MLIDAWWFENKQQDKDLLQPEWFTPKTHCGIYAELKELEFPFNLFVQGFRKTKEIFSKKVDIYDIGNSIYYDLFVKNNTVLIKLFAENIYGLPDFIRVTIQFANIVYKKQIKCKYSLIQGKITDFRGKPFPAAIVFERKAFGGKCPYIGIWSDKAGQYSVTVPNGLYCAFYVCNNSYKESILENWSWKMYVDRDETHNFKIGTGEVYGLSIWENSGGGNILFLYFRPMILPQIKMQKHSITLNNENREVIDIQPDLETKDLHVYIDNQNIKIFSLQRIYETSNYTVIAYVVQVEKPVLNRGKHTVIVEYETVGKYKSQSQGRTQFFIDIP